MSTARTCRYTLADALDEEDPLPPSDRPAPDPRVTLDTLYRANAPRLLRFFARRAGREEAGDLVHETFARFAGLEESKRSEVDRPEAYLGTVAANLLRDRARLAARRALDRHDALDENRTPASDPHQLLEDRDALVRLERAVARLHPRRRRIFLLHRLEHLTYAEIAEEVGMSVKGVKKQMAKALAQLRRETDRG